MRLLSLLLILSIAGAALLPVIALRYSCDTASAVESAAGFVVLLAVAGFLWTYRRRPRRPAGRGALEYPVPVGSVLGLLWVVEIAINNLIAPPLPARDIIDDTFWAVIALGVLLCAAVCAYRAKIETFAGAFLHLIVLGLVMGGLLGVVGGLLGRSFAGRSNEA